MDDTWKTTIVLSMMATAETRRMEKAAAENKPYVHMNYRVVR
jgi:F0F1-type ATP synthase gamma subunit